MGLAGWLPVFLFTQAIEVPIYARALRRADAGRTLLAAAAIAFGASALTHPVVWFVMPGVTDALLAWLARRGVGLVWSAAFRLALFGVLCEGFAVGVEALYLRAFRLPRALLWSLVANFASASVGFACTTLLGWP